MVKDDEVVGGSNNLGQNVARLKKWKNCQILSKSKKAILDKFKIMVNSTVATNAGATGYLTSEYREIFTRLR